jgi:hypothetical protein
VLALSIGLWATAVGLGHGPLAGVPVFDVVDVVTYSAFLAWTSLAA